MGVKDALLIYLSEYITFMKPAGVEQSRKCKKWQQKKNEAEIPNFSKVKRRPQ